MDKEQFHQNVPNSSNFPQRSSVELPGAFALLQEAWKIYKERFVVFLGIMFLPALIGIVITLIAMGLGYITFWKGIVEPTNIAAWGTFAVTMLIIVIVIAIFQSWGYLALIYAIKNRQEKIGLKEAYKRSIPVLTSYWWVSFLTGIIVIIGFVLLIIPGIILAVWYGFSILVLVSEGLKGMEALNKSKSYVSGRFLTVFVKMAFIGIIGFIISLILSKILGSFGQYVTSLLFGPLAATYYFLLYEYCRKTAVV